MNSRHYDFLVVGGGAAGASAAYELAAHGSVAVLERETMPGYHSTGRSAASFTATYGHAVVRALTIGSRPFFEDPPEGFADHSLLTPRGALMIGRADQRGKLEEAFAAWGNEAGAAVQLLDAAAVIDMVPVLRRDYVAGAVYEPDSMDMDVHALHQGFLRLARGRSVTLFTDAGVDALSRSGGTWTAGTRAGEFCAPIVVNAAGAWADEVARLAGAAPLGLVPKRRTAFTFQPPDGVASGAWPTVIDIDETFYFKPDAGRILGSPADETPTEPCDAQPEDIDVAHGIDRIGRATTLEILRIDSKWAGLRTFAPDKVLVAGADPHAEGFFWLAGQGGYGIMTSPAMARVTAGLICEGALPADLAALGIAEAALSPARFQ